MCIRDSLATTPSGAGRAANTAPKLSVWRSVGPSVMLSSSVSSGSSVALSSAVSPGQSASPSSSVPVLLLAMMHEVVMKMVDEMVMSDGGGLEMMKVMATRR